MKYEASTRHTISYKMKNVLGYDRKKKLGHTRYGTTVIEYVIQ